MLDSGWRNKAEKLRVTILSSAHPVARELGPGLQRVLSAFRGVALSGDGRHLQQELASVPPDVVTPVWESTEIYGWKIKATLYKREDQLWWLVYAVQASDRVPSAKELSFLHKILEYLGASPRQHVIIEALSAPPGEPKLSFGWWTWQNQAPLLEVQVRQHALLEVQVRQQGMDTELRVVPIGAPVSDGVQPSVVSDEDVVQVSTIGSAADEIVVEIPIPVQIADDAEKP